MKSSRRILLTVVILVIALCLAGMAKADDMGTAFTYQGRLYDANSPSEGEYDMEFKLYTHPDMPLLAGSTSVDNVEVTDGYFTVGLDFGTDIFTGDARWLEIGVREGQFEDPNTYSALSPRQELTPAPYAIYAADSADDADWSGAATGQMYATNVTDNVGIGTDSPQGKLTVNGAILRDGSTMYGTNADTHINLGVSSTTGTDGQDYSYITVGGGVNNMAMGDYTTVDGGYINVASSDYTTVGGGYANTASQDYAMVGGGYANTANGHYAAVGAGQFNMASGDYASIPGGRNNAASGDDSFAAGRSAKANHDGTFVWADSTGADFTSTGVDQYLIRASGGVGIGTNNPSQELEVNGTVEATAFVGDGSGLTGIATGDSDWSGAGSGSMYTTTLSDNVGIGTSSPSPSAKLTVNGAILRQGSTMYGNNAHTHINLGTNSTTGTNGQIYYYCTVAGGTDNTASGNYATVSGGGANTANVRATVAGGTGNKANGIYATIGGGAINDANGIFATVPGGKDNTAGGDYSFAAGRRAKVRDAVGSGDFDGDEGSFVWADSTDADFTSTAPNRFMVRASGGVYLYTNSGLVTGAYLSSGSGTWSSVSDRAAKEDFSPVDTGEVLEKLVSIPITTWKYKPEADPIRHIGPMAQDLYAAFGLGDSDKSITTIDADGISFAAIQGLYQLAQEKDAEITAQDAQIAALKERLAKMEAAVAKLTGRQLGD